MRGALLFYVPDSPITWLIARATDGPYCHVEVALDNETAIGAFAQGIRYRRINWSRVKGVFVPHVEALDRDLGINWLRQQLGHSYGWEDIANAALRILHIPLFFGVRAQYDCSDLATRYLRIIGSKALPDALAEAPHTVTPNDLWRALSARVKDPELVRPAQSLH